MEFSSEESLTEYVLTNLYRIKPLGDAFVSAKGKEISIAFPSIDGKNEVWFSVATNHAPCLNDFQKFRLVETALELKNARIANGSTVTKDSSDTRNWNKYDSNAVAYKCLFRLYETNSEFRETLERIFMDIKSQFLNMYDSGHHRTVFNEYKKQELTSAFKKAATACMKSGVDYEVLRDELDKLLVKYVDGE